MPGPRVSHAGGDRVPFVAQSRCLAPCVEDGLPPRVWPVYPEPTDDEKEESVDRFGQDITQSGLEENVSGATSVGSPLARWEGRRHLPPRPHG